MITQNKFWLFLGFAIASLGGFFFYERYIEPPKPVSLTVDFRAYKAWPINYRYSVNGFMHSHTSPAYVGYESEGDLGGWSGGIRLDYIENSEGRNVFDIELNWLEIYTGKEYLASTTIDLRDYSYLKDDGYGYTIEVVFEKNGAARISVDSEKFVNHVRGKGYIAPDEMRTEIVLLCGNVVTQETTPLKQIFQDDGMGIHIAEREIGQYRGGFVPEDSCEGES